MFPLVDPCTILSTGFMPIIDHTILIQRLHVARCWPLEGLSSYFNPRREVSTGPYDPPNSPEGQVVPGLALDSGPLMVEMAPIWPDCPSHLVWPWLPLIHPQTGPWGPWDLLFLHFAPFDGNYHPQQAILTLVPPSSPFLFPPFFILFDPLRGFKGPL